MGRFIAVTAMHHMRRRLIQFLALCLAICVVGTIIVLMWHGKLGNPQAGSSSTPATYVDESLGFRISLPPRWVVLSAAEAAGISSEGQRALPGSASNLKKLDTEHPHGKARLLTAMDPINRESFQVLSEEQPSPVDETRPEATANELRSAFVRLLAMRPLGSIERLGGVRPVAHFSGVLIVNGAQIYQSVFVTLTKDTKITFVFSGSANNVLAESERSFPEWVSFDRTAVR